MTARAQSQPMTTIFSKPDRLHINWLWRCTSPWPHKKGIIILECQSLPCRSTYISQATRTYTISHRT
jgi:hypothetical protein